MLDFSPFYGGASAERAELGAKLFASFRDIGFATLVNHNLPAELNRRTFEARAHPGGGPTQVHVP